MTRSGEPHGRPPGDTGDDVAPTLRGRRGRRLIILIAMAVLVVVAVVWAVLYTAAR